MPLGVMANRDQPEPPNRATMPTTAHPLRVQASQDQASDPRPGKRRPRQRPSITHQAFCSILSRRGWG